MSIGNFNSNPPKIDLVTSAPQLEKKQEEGELQSKKELPHESQLIMENNLKGIKKEEIILIEPPRLQLQSGITQSGSITAPIFSSEIIIEKAIHGEKIIPTTKKVVKEEYIDLDAKLAMIEKRLSEICKLAEGVQGYSAEHLFIVGDPKQNIIGHGEELKVLRESLTLIQKDLVDVVHYANMGSKNEGDEKIYNGAQEELRKLGFQDCSSDRNNKMFFSTKTKTICSLALYSNRKIVIAFFGLGFETKLKISAGEKLVIGLQNLKHAGTDSCGGCSSAMFEAMEMGKIMNAFCERVNTGVEDPRLHYKTIFIGHSHGGAVAQGGAAANGMEAMIFNSQSLGIGARREIEKKAQENGVDVSDNQIKEFNIKGDPLTGSLSDGLRFLDNIGLGIKTIVKISYTLPGDNGKSGEDYKKYENLHNDFSTAGQDAWDRVQNIINKTRDPFQ